MHGSRRAGGSGAGARRGAGPDQQRPHRRGHRQHRRHTARRHRRGIQPGVDRGEPRRHHGRRGSVHPGRPASGHLQPDLHAATASRSSWSRTRSCRPDSRRPSTRSCRSVRSRRRSPSPARRRWSTCSHPPGRGARHRGARRHPDRPQHAVHRAVDRRHQAEPARGRSVDLGAADGHDDPRDELAAGQRGGGRAARQRHRPRRRHPELPQRAVDPGDDLRDERDDRRDLGGRGPHQHDSARGRQHVQRTVLHGLLQQRAGRRPHPCPGRQAVVAGWDRAGALVRGQRAFLGHQRRLRRPDSARQVLVLHEHAALAGGQADHRQLLPQPGRHVAAVLRCPIR